jgi:hypothetical protein
MKTINDLLVTKQKIEENYRIENEKFSNEVSISLYKQLSDTLDNLELSDNFKKILKSFNRLELVIEKNIGSDWIENNNILALHNADFTLYIVIDSEFRTSLDNSTCSELYIIDDSVLKYISSLGIDIDELSETFTLDVGNISLFLENLVSYNDIFYRNIIHYV